MWTHERVWAALDALAQRNGLTSSGLARKAGLDPTAFNKSKRFGADNRPRWPSTESIGKVLEATQTGLQDFIEAMGGARKPDIVDAGGVLLPVLGLAQAGQGGFFDDGGFPLGHGFDEVQLPKVDNHSAYALQVSGDSMLPLYRHGDIIVVSPEAGIRKGDRVVVRTRDGEVMVKELEKQTARTVILHSLNPDHQARTLKHEDISWMARILWATQ